MIPRFIKCKNRIFNTSLITQVHLGSAQGLTIDVDGYSYIYPKAGFMHSALELYLSGLTRTDLAFGTCFDCEELMKEGLEVEKQMEDEIKKFK